MWIRFTAAFTFAATAAVSIAFKPDGGPLKDGRYQVTRACGLAVIAAGAGVECSRPAGLPRKDYGSAAWPQVS